MTNLEIINKLENDINFYYYLLTLDSIRIKKIAKLCLENHKYDVFLNLFRPLTINNNGEEKIIMVADVFSDKYLDIWNYIESLVSCNSINYEYEKAKKKYDEYLELQKQINSLVGHSKEYPSYSFEMFESEHIICEDKTIKNMLINKLNDIDFEKISQMKVCNIHPRNRNGFIHLKNEHDIITLTELPCISACRLLNDFGIPIVANYTDCNIEDKNTNGFCVIGIDAKRLNINNQSHLNRLIERGYAYNKDDQINVVYISLPINKNMTIGEISQRMMILCTGFSHQLDKKTNYRN